METSKYTVADVFNRFAPGFIENNHITYDQLKVINHITKCRTAAMGGHWKACKVCGVLKVHYSSCGNRHCPSCQGVNKEKWIMEREYDLLPVKYFHVVFTIPSQLRLLFMQNKKLLYSLLFKCSWQTLAEFAADPRQKMEGKIGSIAILHTWTQKLIYHPHIHFIVPEGGIDKYDQWKKSKGSRDFLFHVNALAAKFRGKLLHNINELYVNNELRLNGKLSVLKNKKQFLSLKDSLYKLKWVVNCKEPFNGPSSVLEYLGRYTHKIAISNYRILDIDDKGVTFSYLDRNDNDKKKSLWLNGEKFIQRFLWHVLPKGFTRIRHYGFLSCRVKKDMLPLIRKLLNHPEPGKKPKLTIRDVMFKKWGIDTNICNECKEGIMMVVEEIIAIRGSPAA
ncbi:MAG: IS91 family transposase [Mesoflavibacter sp.]|nr:IS91 family transposase [Mesoflavibacter sp.]